MTKPEKLPWVCEGSKTTTNKHTGQKVLDLSNRPTRRAWLKWGINNLDQTNGAKR